MTSCRVEGILTTPRGGGAAPQAFFLWFPTTNPERAPPPIPDLPLQFPRPFSHRRTTSLFHRERQRPPPHPPPPPPTPPSPPPPPASTADARHSPDRWRFGWPPPLLKGFPELAQISSAFSRLQTFFFKQLPSIFPAPKMILPSSHERSTSYLPGQFFLNPWIFWPFHAPLLSLVFLPGVQAWIFEHVF